MIYPENKKTDNTFHKKNITDMRKKQEDNKLKKYEQENAVQRNLYEN